MIRAPGHVATLVGPRPNRAVAMPDRGTVCRTPDARTRSSVAGEDGAGVLDDGGDLLVGELARPNAGIPPRPLVTTAIWSAGSG